MRLQAFLWAGSLWTVPACAPESDASRYHRALVQAPTFEEARPHCVAIGAPDARGDCLTAVMERFERLDAADCDAVDVPRWQDECRFLLAERQRQAGDLDGALRTCLRTAYRRSCAWHLLRDEAEAAASLDMVEASARLAPFEQVTPLPDAARQFWLVRFRARGARGETLDERVCDEVADVPSCRDAVQEHVRSMLDAVGRLDRDTVCAADAGQRATVRGAPAWAMGELTLQAEQDWVRVRCHGGPLPPSAPGMVAPEEVGAPGAARRVQPARPPDGEPAVLPSGDRDPVGRDPVGPVGQDPVGEPGD